jgi:hypothetical protein
MHDLQSKSDMIMNTVPVPEEVKHRAYAFEKSHSLEQIRSVALRTMCGKLDRELVMRFKIKEELVEYLHSKNCPALMYLESSMLPS